MVSSLAIQEDRYAFFRESVTPDLYEADRFVDWQAVEKQLREYDSAIGYIASLNACVDGRVISSGLVKEHHLYRVLTLLLSVEHAVGFSDGRELPDPDDANNANPEELASLLMDLGVGDFVLPKHELISAVRSALVARDARSRRYRMGKTFNERLAHIIDTAIEEINNNGLNIHQLPKCDWPFEAEAKSSVEYLLAIDGRPFVAIESVFQTVTGGRQLRDLSNKYPVLRSELLELGIDLILIADGRGLRHASSNVFDKLFQGVPTCLTLNLAMNGMLSKSIMKMAKKVLPSAKWIALDQLIERQLETEGVVRAQDLPVGTDSARLALAKFAAKQTGLALYLDPLGNSLGWKRVSSLTKANLLLQKFVPMDAVLNFAELIDCTLVGDVENYGKYICSSIVINGNDSVLPDKMLVTASCQAPDADIIREVAAKALNKTPNAKMCVLLCPDEKSLFFDDIMRGLQATLAVNVIILSAVDLLEMTKTSQLPLARLASHLLEQSDLIKASPFVINSVTPRRMFYGRAAEAASMVSALATNSVALLGGRRIGKTSLMRHVGEQLESAGFSPYFGDCQTVRTWDDFSRLASHLWKVNLPIPFHPSNIADLVAKLKQRTDGKVVLLLDEVDQLLDWDRLHSKNEVPEAFFRACRAVSQEGEAQFVFSGERIIANRIWDSHSPHWNFCHPLMLRQLDRGAAADLIVKPLKDMQINIIDVDQFVDMVWSRSGGHPQLIQVLGDGLIHLLNERPSGERGVLGLNDLLTVTETFTYAERYISTYWGQSTPLDKLISLLVASNVLTLAAVRDILQQNGISIGDDEVSASFRMLALYGIIEPGGEGYQLRLEWFIDAAKFYGGIEAIIENYLEAIRE